MWRPATGLRSGRERVTAGLCIGVDIGSSGAKAMAFDRNWAVVGSGRRSYRPRLGLDGAVALDVPDLLRAVEEAVAECLAMAFQGSQTSPVVIAFACLGEAIVPVGADGVPLAEAMLTADARLAGASAWWSERFDPLWLRAHTGLPLRDSWAANAILFHQRRVSATQYWSVADVVTASLGLVPRMARSLASRSLLVEQATGAWSPDLLAAMALPRTALPDIADPGTVIGEIRDSNRMGLPRGSLLAVGGHDQFCAATGCGATRERPMWSTGTVDSFTVLSDAPAPGAVAVPSYQVDRTLFASPVANLNAGRVLTWLSDMLGVSDIGSVVALTDQPERLLMCPTLGTAGAPDFSPGFTGAFIGLRYEDGRADLVGAAIEGIVLETRRAVQSSRLDLAQVEAIVAAGGGALSARWLRLKAEAFDRPVLRRLHADAGCVGAAMLACQARDGVRPLIEDANPVISRSLPSAAGRERFERQAERYDVLRGQMPIVTHVETP